MSTSTSFGTLSEFLLQAGTEYFVIDVSRTRCILDNQQFFDYETNRRPFAHPRQGHAWLCIVFWNKQLSQEHYIWFLKFPLDEQSLMQLAARDQFLQTVTEALGQQLQRMQDEQIELPDNPFVFTPSQQLLADCNTFIRAKLNVPQKMSSNKALNYLKAPSVQPWSELSVQNISDLAIRISQHEVKHAYVQNLKILPHAVHVCLCSSFEGLELPDEVVRSILSFHMDCESSIAPLLLRALASSQTTEVLHYLCRLIIDTDDIDTDTFVVIAGRHWQVLSPENSVCAAYLNGVAESRYLLHIYFEKLALADSSYALFRGIYADLVQISSLRVFLLAMLREPNLQGELAAAVSSLFEMS